MANKQKKIIENNLEQIREELHLTKREMATLFKVNERMIYDYEHNETNLPIESAIYLSQEFNYSLDWIYNNKQNDYESDDDKEQTYDFRKKFDMVNYTEKECYSFLVDIRDYIHVADDFVKLSINKPYWEYMSKMYHINQENITEKEKSLKIARLNSKYVGSDMNEITWEITIPRSEFISKFQSVPYISDINYMPPTKKELEELNSFLTLLSLNNDLE